MRKALPELLGVKKGKTDESEGKEGKGEEEIEVEKEEVELEAMREALEAQMKQKSKKEKKRERKVGISRACRGKIRVSKLPFPPYFPLFSPTVSAEKSGIHWKSRGCNG